MRRLLPLLLAVLLTLAPALSWARPTFSAGSRGTHTYSTIPGTNTSPSGASPLQRSITPDGGSYGGSSSYGYGQGYGSSYGGFSRRSSFTSGLLGGLVGAGLGGMLFGRGFFGGMHGGGGFLGLLIQLALLYFVGRWLFRRFFAGVPAAAGPGFLGRNFGAMPRSMSGSGFGFGGGGRSNRPITIAQPDYQAFEQLLKNVQAAWSAHDLNGLSTMATPEMVGYFGEQLAEQTSRGVRNQVTDVRLQQGDLAEAWSEGSREYATVALRFSMVDVTYDASRHVVDGSPNERVTATEVWTFVRSPGARWILSAIQQTK